MKTNYVCSNCGGIYSKWYGKCPDCGEWNSFEESAEETPPKKGSKVRKTAALKGDSRVFALNDIPKSEKIRYQTGMNEFDRVLGGGLVKGSVVLLAGEPGIGKSTLLLQICANLGENHKILYISGEESPSQIKLRASRLGVDTQNLFILCETDISKIIPELNSLLPDIVLVDSVQTIYDEDLSPSPGSVAQVKAAARIFIEIAKTNGISVIMVGHVNKDGGIAGPKVLEHMVDAVLYFEGDKLYAYRIIRSVKNRFGSTNEIGVFQMSEYGLEEIPNPSEMLISERPDNVPGSCAVCVMEGTRPIVAEVQALAVQSVFPSPRRLATGLDYNRVNLILAVLEKRLGLKFGLNDVYVNVAGGLELKEPSGDLATAMALISSYKNIVIPKEYIAFGEVGLAGECRTVSNAENRINEAIRLGFKKIIVPYKTVSRLKKKYSGVEIVPVKSVFEILPIIS
ncbi:MAG: DNA repair protein RadA [Clostridiales bacterium]|jgi:DNA repair protein RadA/Sms|nr:DNA repair protein RadA [Clostridiales bacterium]